MSGAIQQDTTSTATYMPVEQQRETNDVVFKMEDPGPATRAEQSRPEVSVARGSEWSNTTHNEGVSTEAPGGEWNRPVQTEPESQGNRGGQDVKQSTKTPEW